MKDRKEIQSLLEHSRLTEAVFRGAQVEKGCTPSLLTRSNNCEGGPERLSGANCENETEKGE